MADGETPEKSGDEEVQAPERGNEGAEKPENLPDPDYAMDGHEENLQAVVDGASEEDEEEEDTADTGDVEDEDEDDEDEEEEEDEDEDEDTADTGDVEEEDEEESNQDQDGGDEGTRDGAGADDEEEEEDDFWGPVMEAYEEEGVGAAIILAIKLWTGWGDDEKKEAGESEDGENPLFRTDLFETDDPESKKLLETAKTELDKVKEDNPTWIDLAFKASEEYDLGPKGPATILAMARFESHFNPEAVAESTQATGLGQFIEGTWDGFQASLDEDSPYKGKPATDPEASIMAIAWYSAENMKDCKIKPTDPEFTAKLYEAHHQGAQGAKTMWKFREEGKPEGEIPGWAKGKPFKSFGVEKVETYEDYALLVDAMSGKVQLVADMYQGEIEASEDNSDE